MPRMVWVLVGAIGLLIAEPAHAQLNPEQLKIITDTAATICKQVDEAKGSRSEGEISGDVGAQLNGVLGKIANLGAGAKGTYKFENFEGLKQDATAIALRDQAKCRKDVFDKLIDRISAAPSDPFEPYRNHAYRNGEIPQGYRCQVSTDCKPAPTRGHCYPVPPNNEEKYCEDGASNCAWPGTSGVMYGTIKEYLGRKFQCFQPAANDGQARWRLVN